MPPSVLEINMTTVATLAVLALVFAFLIDAGPVLVPSLLSTRYSRPPLIAVKT